MQAIPSSEEEQEDVDLPPAKEVVVVEEDAAPKLVLWQGVALLTADCLGVGVLALPHDIKTLGWGLGFSFLIANFPINYYAGNLLSVIALDVEDSTSDDIVTPKDDDKGGFELTPSSTTSSSTKENDGAIYRRKSQQYSGIPHQDKQMVTAVEEDVFHDEDIADGDESPHLAEHEETSTSTSTTTQAYDLISITKAVFGAKYVTRLVVLIYYMNLFLVLGDYVLVMGRAVSAIFLDEICLPTAGAIASLLMFAVCQLRTMANLGRKVSLASLLALLIVLLQCIFHHRNSSGGSSTPTTMTVDDNNTDEKEDGIWQRFSAFASIGFAVGSQKLFLNIRHELQHREEASQALAWSLTSYGFAYVLVILLAGSNPPSFLFDSIPEGWSRRVAGLLLWGHVAVSYAINSQALCSSMDRFLVAASSRTLAGIDPARRWFVLTFAVALSSYLVSNAVPFFKDLVALIGALTSVPLTLTLPALLHRKVNQISILLPGWRFPSMDSYSLFLYSLGFLVVGLMGALSSIDEDWISHGRPFSCR